MIFDLLVLGVAGYFGYTKLWKPVHDKIIGFHAEMSASWNGICGQIRVRQAAGARILDLVKSVAPQDPFVQDFEKPLAEQSQNLDDVQLVASREEPFVSLLKSSLLLQEAFPTLAADSRWAGAQQAVQKANSNLDILRNQYNGAVTAYNKLFETFPANIVCSVCRVQPAAVFEAAPAITKEDVA